MKHKTKEMYFIFGLIIIIMAAFFLGRYFTLSTCLEKEVFKADQIEKCNYDREVYYEICGDVNHLMDNEQMQSCIMECRGG